MSPEEMQEIFRRDLAAYRYDPPAAETTVGVPWSSKKTLEGIQRLRLAVVTPYRQEFELVETYEQSLSSVKTVREYWVVAETRDYLEWYDPEAGEYGLGERREGSLPVSIGVRGDLVGVFCAM